MSGALDNNVVWAFLMLFILRVRHKNVYYNIILLIYQASGCPGELICGSSVSCSCFIELITKNLWIRIPAPDSRIRTPPIKEKKGRGHFLCQEVTGFSGLCRLSVHCFTVRPNTNTQLHSHPNIQLPPPAFISWLMHNFMHIAICWLYLENFLERRTFAISLTLYTNFPHI